MGKNKNSPTGVHRVTHVDRTGRYELSRRVVRICPVKPTRYSGAILRALRAEKGVGKRPAANVHAR